MCSQKSTSTPILSLPWTDPIVPKLNYSTKETGAWSQKDNMLDGIGSALSLQSYCQSPAFKKIFFGVLWVQSQQRRPCTDTFVSCSSSTQHRKVIKAFLSAGHSITVSWFSLLCKETFKIDITYINTIHTIMSDKLPFTFHHLHLTFATVLLFCLNED